MFHTSLQWTKINACMSLCAYASVSIDVCLCVCMCDNLSISAIPGGSFYTQGDTSQSLQ